MSDLRWRPTRLEAEDKATLSRALVFEVPGQGWRWSATRGGATARGVESSKIRAIAAATEAMRAPPRGVS